MLGLLLLILSSMTPCLIASGINLQEYEEASKNVARYGNACIVRSYQDDVLLQQGNGTLCEHKGIKFILTTSEIISGNSYTVLFEGEGEDAITFPETLDLTNRFGYKRSKIAISFMYSYPPRITPAQIDACADFNHRLAETHVVGYAATLLPQSSRNLVFFNPDGAMSKRIMVPFNPTPIRQSIGTCTSSVTDLKSTTGDCSDIFRGFELPLPPGIMGAAIRTQEGNVAGVALGSIPYWCTEKYLELHPIKYRLLHMANAFMKKIQNRFSFSTLSIGILLSQAALTYSPPLGIASYCAMGAAAWLSYRLPLLAKTWEHYRFPAGSENYGLQLLPWMTDLEVKLNTHQQNRLEAYR